MSEEDFYSYGSSAQPYIEPASIDPTTYICKEPLSAASVATFWRTRLRCCDTKTFITADNYSSCRVAPAGTAVSVDLLVNSEYEFTPELLKTNNDDTVITIALFLGERYCNPHTFGILCPFRIRQTENFYYISQGLETEVVNRNGKKPLTIASSGLSFTVNLVL